MKCPQCNKTLQYPSYAWNNAINYGKSVRVTTECCGKIVSISPVYSVRVEKAEGIDYGEGPVDDWGVPAGKPHKSIGV